MSTVPRLAVTLGDPRGIGPEITTAVRRDPALRATATLVLVGPAGTGVDVDEPIGDWNPLGTAADAGRREGIPGPDHAVRPGHASDRRLPAHTEGERDVDDDRAAVH